MIGLDDVRAAARGLEGVANRTPALTSRTLDGMVGAAVHVKAECFQRGGAFKFRGAYTKIASLDDDARSRGVVAYSSGNHAQAVAIAAQLLSTHAMAAEHGLELVKPYDDPLVMAGQGTAALELLEDVPDLDLLVAPVGGGGLIAGCSTAVKGLRPEIRVVGVEPEAGDDTRRSLAAGQRVHVGVPRTIADGLQAAEPGELTFEVNRKNVDEVVIASDAEILDAMAFLFDRMKIVTEPSGAIGVAALLAGRIDAPRGGRVGVIVSGGNVGVARFAELLGRV